MHTSTTLSLLSRRQELRELRFLQKEEQRAQQQLSNKLQQQKEQILRRFEQETTVSRSSHKGFTVLMHPTKRQFVSMFPTIVWSLRRPGHGRNMRRNVALRGVGCSI